VGVLRQHSLTLRAAWWTAWCECQTRTTTLARTEQGQEGHVKEVPGFEAGVGEGGHGLPRGGRLKGHVRLGP
jgi:hypothetical protein